MRERAMIHRVKPVVDRHLASGGYLTPFAGRRIALRSRDGTLVAVLPEFYAFILFVGASND